MEQELKIDVQETLLSMTPENWILLRRRLDMSRQEIQSDEGTLMLALVWKATGPTSDNLAKLMSAPEKELYEAMGINLDEALAEANAVDE